LQRGDECFPVARNELCLTSHRLGQSVDHLFLVADVAIGIGRIGEDVRCAATRIGAPTQDSLRHNRIAKKESQPQKSTKGTKEFGQIICQALNHLSS
jgi:hypothetical protein